MKLELCIKETFDDRRIGGLYVDGVFRWHTLEDADRQLESGGIKIPGQTAIPKGGSYPVTIDWSDAHRCLALHILNVPQFEGIRFDIANRPEEIKGCIAVGMGIIYDQGKAVLSNSTQAVKELSLMVLEALIRIEVVELTIS